MVKGILPLFLSLLMLWPELSQAQSFFTIKRQRNLILTGGTGSSTYYGELTNPGTYIKYQPNFNVGIQKYYTPRIYLRAELNWFELKGSDSQANEISRLNRGLSFRSSCFELSGIGAISLYANGNRYYRRPLINIYGFAGLGLLYFNPKADYKGKAYALEPLHTEGKSYSRVVPVIPFGLGVRLKTGPNTNLVLEGGYRKTFTDYLDDVSTKYIPKTNDLTRDYFLNPNNVTYNPDATGNTNVYKEGSIRGNPNKMDSYFLLNVKVEYYLPISQKSRRGGSGLIYGGKRNSMYRYNKRGGLKRRK